MNISKRPLLARMGLVAQTTRWRPTLAAWSVAVLLLALAGVGCVRFAFPFLAVTDRVETRVLVVEGWLPDLMPIDPVLSEFRDGRYDLLVVTGGPTPRRELLGDFGTYAELTRTILVRKGLDPEVVVAVPSIGVAKDRTYATAVALRRWIEEKRPEVRAVNLLTLGAHARRSRLMFQEALGDRVKVGVISTGDLRYSGGRWWKSSSGVREVLGESLAYCYARLVFRP